MTTTEYEDGVRRTMADQREIQQRLRALPVNLVQIDCGIRGLTDEVGELAAITKRVIEYGRSTTHEELRAALLEETGDALYRITQILDAIGFTLQDAMIANRKKLERRYPNGFCPIKEIERDPETEMAVIRDTIGA